MKKVEFCVRVREKEVRVSVCVCKREKRKECMHDGGVDAGLRMM